jgi:hypothetical protein
MVGCPQAEIEDQVEIMSGRGRIFEDTDRAAAKQEVEGVPTVFGVGHGVVENAMGNWPVHVFLRA